MGSNAERWRAFKKAALKAHRILWEEMSHSSGAPPQETEISLRVQIYRLIIMLSAGARGFLDIPDWKKSPRPFQQNILRWARENPPYMRRAFEYGELFEPAKQPHLWKFRPGEEPLKNAIELLMETDPSSWEPSWPGDIYPHIISSGRRKDTGSFYTPWPVVQFIVDKALGPLCYGQPDRRRKPRDEKEILSLKILEPAIGGGRFIMAAVDYLARALAEARGQEPGIEHLRAVAGRVYGVDSDPMAVEIARACLWLFLGGPERPWNYLRNNLQAGDALIGATMEEIDRDQTRADDDEQLTLFKSEAPKREFTPLKAIVESGRLIPRIEALADLWTAAMLDVEQARKEFPLVRMSLPHVSEDRWADLESRPGFQEARRFAKEMKFFHWELRFPEVFIYGPKERRGFDAVIGNPPYRRERGGGAGLPVRQAPLARQWGEGKTDLLALFMHRGLDLLNQSGRISFITSNYWLRAEGASKLRKRLANDERMILFVDLADFPVFEGVSGRHGILAAAKGVRHPHPTRILRLKPEINNDRDDLGMLLAKIRENFTEEEFLDQRELLDRAGNFNLSDKAADHICRRMEENGEPLGTISDSSQGIVENPPELTDRMIRGLAESNPKLVEEEGYEAGEAVFLLPPDHHLIPTLGEEEKAFLRPYYRPSSIRRYHLAEKPDGYLLYLTPRTCPDITKFPWLREHLERYRVFMEERREVKEGRIKWWHLHWPREESMFEGEHLLLPQMADQPRTARAAGPAYGGMSVHVIVPRENVSATFIMAVLNSRAVEYYLTEGGRAKERGARVDITLSALRRIPIPAALGKSAGNTEKSEELFDLYRDWISSPDK